VLSFSRLKGPKEKTMGLVGVIRDLGVIKELRAQLVQSGKLTALGQLAAEVAHEINNHLTVVSGHVQLLLSEVDDPETKSILRLVNSELNRCKDITQGLLSFSRGSKTKKFEELDLNKCVENALLLLKHKLALSNIKLIMRLGKNLPGIRGNFSQLQQVFINLVFNAIDAMTSTRPRRDFDEFSRVARSSRSFESPKGGNLYIRTSPVNNKYVKATVTDTGIGVLPEDLPRIFEPFFTTKEPGRGVGLGLSIIHGIIKDHGGEIEVNSCVDKKNKKVLPAGRHGKTTFIITLPACVKTSAGRPVSRKGK
jgi:signal transduction histidine kinase